jgi:hypothetical protein
MPIPLAHPGHWLVELAYVMPVLVVVVWISVRAIIDRRRGGAQADEAEPPPPPPPPPPAGDFEPTR